MKPLNQVFFLVGLYKPVLRATHRHSVYRYVLRFYKANLRAKNQLRNYRYYRMGRELHASVGLV